MIDGAGRRPRAPRFEFATSLLILALGAPACHKRPDRATPHAMVPPRVIVASAPQPSASAPAPTGALREVVFEYSDSPVGPSNVVIAVPSHATKESPLPVLVAFHGRGESLKSPARGARGWIDDYDLKRAVERLTFPPLTSADFGGSIAPDRLKRLNEGLAKDGYRGLIVVCPYLPDAFHGDQAFDDGSRYAHFIVDEVLPRVYREVPAIGTPEATSVDGVSLGGRAALLVGWLRPNAFGAVAALQPALDSAEARPFAALAQRALAENAKLSIRLLTSSEDYFLEPTIELSRELHAHGVKHHTDIVVGTHSYEFNRGPGVYELLIFHDRALRGLEPI